MKPWEWHHIDRQFPEIRVQLTREPEAGGHSAHGQRHKMVQITIGRRGQFQRPKTDVVQRLVVDAESRVCIFDQLVDRQSGVIGFYHGIGHLNIIFI